jgi:hypothetical protein
VVPGLLAAPLLGLLRSPLPRLLQSRLVSTAMGHGFLLPSMVSPRFVCGGKHDQFFMWFQILS